MYPMRMTICTAMATKNTVGDRHGGGIGHPPAA